jgi:hypothetical protein
MFLSGIKKFLSPSDILKRHKRTLYIVQKSYIHAGYASAEGTSSFIDQKDAAKKHLRVNGQEIRVGRVGIGSPYTWAKDIPRIESSKLLILSQNANFIQASVNPFHSSTASSSGNGEANVESVVLNELITENEVPRDHLVVSAIIEDSLLYPSMISLEERFSSEKIQQSVTQALNELKVEAIDTLVYRLPEEFLSLDNGNGKELLYRAINTLEELSHRGKFTGYGFALPNVWAASSTNVDTIVEALEKSLSKASERMSLLQMPVNLSIGLEDISLPNTLHQLSEEHELFLIGEKSFDATLSNGKPFLLRDYRQHLGEDVALLLKTAFNLAISIERKYMEVLHAKHSVNESIPTCEEVAWAHILANQHGQFDNFEEWVYIRETQLFPRIEATLKRFSEIEDLKEFGFAYSMAIRDLLKCFSASIEVSHVWFIYIALTVD